MTPERWREFGGLGVAVLTLSPLLPVVLLAGLVWWPLDVCRSAARRLGFAAGRVDVVGALGAVAWYTAFVALALLATSGCTPLR